MTDRMNLFYFGSRQKPLLGIYHPPLGGGALDRGAVLCYPMGAAYLRSHAAFRQLASLLTRRGVHVLRFEYYGTGDSGGRAEEAGIEQWLDDVDAAVVELRATTGIRRVCLVGQEMGGTLAALAAERRNDLDQVVLWDPVVHGESHVEALAAHAGGTPPRFPPPDRVRGPGIRLPASRAAPGGSRERDLGGGSVGARVGAAGVAWGTAWGTGWAGPEGAGAGGAAAATAGTLLVEGFPVTEPMRAAIAEIDLARREGLKARRLHLLVSREELHYFRLRDRWRALDMPHRYRCIPGAPSAPGDSGGVRTVPTEILLGIVACLA